MMKKETLEIINNSQFKEVYFLMMNMEQTGRKRQKEKFRKSTTAMPVWR